MIADLKPYPAMKDSTLPWAGEVPEHWSLIPNRAMLRRRKVLVGNRHTEYKLLSLTKTGVIVRDISTGRGKFSADMGTHQEVRTGDLVFCLFDVPETPRTVGLSQQQGMITGAYTVFECGDDLLARFLEAFYIAMDDRKLLSPLYSGLRNTIPPTRFLGTKTPVPPADEQAAIVRYLDHVNRRVQRFVRAKQKLIGLLEEQKQAIIHRAVTRGLDPDVPLKDSGVEWLGEVPEHWEVIRLKFLFRELDERSTTGNERLLSLRMHGGLIPHDTVSDRPVPPSALIGYKRVGSGHLVMNRMRAATGIFGVPARAGLVSPDYAILEPCAGVDPTYFLTLFKTPSMCTEFLFASKGLGTGSSGFMRLYTDQFGRLSVALPPLPEQAEILSHLNDAAREVGAQVDRARREIEFLHEYHTRLVADVVTGKLDVRDVAAKLPEEPSDLEMSDRIDGLCNEGVNAGASPEEAEA